MANWKEIAFKGDLNPIASQAEDANEGEIAIGNSDDNGTVEFVPVNNLNIVVGDSSNHATVVGTAGDVTITGNDGTNATLEIGANKVVTAKLPDATGGTSGSGGTDGVTLAKMQNQDGATLLVYQDATPGNTLTSTHYPPLALAGGSHNQILTTKVAGSNKYLSWEAGSSATSLTISDGTGQSDELPILFGAAVGSAQTVYADETTGPDGTANTRFTYDAVDNKLRVVNIDATTVTASNTLGFVGNATSAEGVKVNASADAASFIGIFNDAGSGSAQTANTHSGITYDATFSSNAGKLTVANLEVTGTSTKVNSEDLIIQDNTITVAVPNGGSGTVALGAKSGLIVSTNAGGGDGADDEAQDVLYNPRFVWNNTSTTIDGSSGTALNAGSAGGAAATTLGWAIAGAGKANTTDTTTTIASTLYNIAPMIVFGGEQTSYPGDGSGTHNTLDVGIGAQFLTYDGTNGADSRLFIQVD